MTASAAYLVFRFPANRARQGAAAGDLTFWQPRGLDLHVSLPGLGFKPTVFSLLSYAGLMARSRFGYGILREPATGELLACCGVYPRYASFPFMGDADVQIGAVFTSEAHRGRGWAGALLKQVLDREPCWGAEVWYLTEMGNTPSIRLCTGLGAQLAGSAQRRRRLGVPFYELSGAEAG